MLHATLSLTAGAVVAIYAPLFFMNVAAWAAPDRRERVSFWDTAFLAGLLRDVSARVNVVNAFLIAEERGIKVTTTYVRKGGELAPAIRTEIRAGDSRRSLAGTLFGYGGQRREGRITEIDGFHIEATPHGHMLVTRNHDVPGVIGGIGTILGQGGVNISRFHLCRRERGGEAMAVIEVDAPLSKETLQSLRSLEQVISAQPIEL